MMKFLRHLFGYPEPKTFANPPDDGSGLVMTKYGLMPKSTLFYRTGRHEDENEIATWQEWWLRPTDTFKTELVQRDAQVQLKHWPEGAIEAGMVAGYPAGTQLKEKA